MISLEILENEKEKCHDNDIEWFAYNAWNLALSNGSSAMFDLTYNLLDVSSNMNDKIKNTKRLCK